MTDSREVVLGRIRSALAEPPRQRSSDTPPMTRPGPAVGIRRSYRQTGEFSGAEALNLFLDRLRDYRASVIPSRAEDLPGTIAERSRIRSLRSLAVPLDLPAEWLAGVPEEQVRVLRDRDPIPLSAKVLDATDGALTGCRVAIAETGTFVLDGGPGQGRRLLSLLPDYHLCVVFARQVVQTVPEAWTVLAGLRSRLAKPITLISGPSATSDIELVRVEGVHGPRTLDVILVEDQ